MLKRFEAGQRPPQQPREINPSSFTAPISRESATLTSYGSLIEAAYKELSVTKVVMPTKKRFLRPIGTVGLGTTNGIRENDFKEQFPGLAMRRLEAHEQHTGKPEIDARSKSVSAAQIERRRRSIFLDILNPLHLQQHRAEIAEKGKGMANPYVGLDAVNAIPEVTQDGRIEYVYVGKPEREAEAKGVDVATLIQDRFAHLAQLAQENNWPSIPYIIEMATHIHNPRGRRNKYDASSVRKAVVMLDPEVIAYIATPEGFAQYQQLSQEADKPAKPILTKVAGGMKLETFEKMGAIQLVTGKPYEFLQQSVPDELQEKRYDRALRLAEGKPDIGFLREYFNRYPLSRRQKRAGWRERQNQPVAY